VIVVWSYPLRMPRLVVRREKAAAEEAGDGVQVGAAEAAEAGAAEKADRMPQGRRS
jgi:hypothetical protein